MYPFLHQGREDYCRWNPFLCFHNLILHKEGKGGDHCGKAFPPLEYFSCSHFCCNGWCSGPYIGHIIGKCPVNFMAYSRNDWNMGFLDCNNDFICGEGGKILLASSTSSNYEKVHVIEVVGLSYTGSDGDFCSLSLDCTGEKYNIQTRSPSSRYIKNVVEDSTGCTGHYAQGPDFLWNWFLVLGVEPAKALVVLLSLFNEGCQLSVSCLGKTGNYEADLSCLFI